MADRSRQTGAEQSGERSAVTASRRSFVRAAGIGIGGLALGGIPGTASARTGVPTPRLHTDGKWIVDPAGNRVTLRGFATASLDFVAYDWYPYSVREVLAWATDWEEWYPNHIRLPCEWEGMQEHGGVEAFVADILRPAVDFLAARNVYAMIDFHLIRPYTDAATDAYNEGEGEELEPIDDVMEAFWGVVATEFADDEHVLYELFNEPTEPYAPWGQYGETVETREESWLLWRDQAQPWVDLIREAAPETPVVIGSPNWTSETQFAPEYPFEGENLIYSSHIYPANGLPYEESEQPGYTLEPFDPEYGAPAEEVPVIVTEFGWDPDEQFAETVEYGTASEWGKPFRAWVEDYPNMGWTGWCFDDSWNPTFFESPGDGAGRPWELKTDPEQQGWFIREWLEETRDERLPESQHAGDEPPTAPGGPTVTHAGEVLAEIAWEAATDPGEAGISHYDVSLDGEHRHLVLPSEALTATVDGLEPSSTYEASVVAVDQAGTESEAATVTVETVAYGSAQSPYGGPAELPGRLEAETFDEGGRGVAYYDATGENAGGALRETETVDVVETDDGEYYVGHVTAEEWLEYTVEVAESGTYETWVSVANGTNSHPNPALRILVNLEEAGETGIWPTGGWESFTDIRVGEMELPAGRNIVRIAAASSGWNVEGIEFDLMEAHEVDRAPLDDRDPNPNPDAPVIDGTAVQDATGDGLYDDITGDGETTHEDVTAFFEHLDSDAVQGDADSFDFAGDGGAGFTDVISLFERL